MGAGAVIRYVASHLDIAATGAISLGSLDEVPPGMLLIVDALEFPRFRTAAAARSPEHRVVKPEIVRSAFGIGQHGQVDVVGIEEGA